MDLEDLLNNIISKTKTDEELHELLQEERYEQQKGLDSINNPFKSWSEEIYLKSKPSLQEETGLNAVYLL